MTRYLMLFVIAALGCSSPSKLLNKEEQRAALKSAMDQKRYVFKAQTVQPTSGRNRQLTSAYSVTLKGDTLISDLPYFGRAYTAPMDVTKSVLQFNSTRFDYNSAPGKKQGWNITIRFNDVSEVQSYSLSISEDGYASLQATLTNRQPISFNGTAEGIK